MNSFPARSALATGVILLASCIPLPVGPKGAPPSTDVPPGPRPSAILEQTQGRKPAALESAADVPAFLDWAGASRVDERETARQVIAQASDNRDVAKGLITEIEATQATNYPRALLALSVLGELRNPVGAAYLVDFVRRPPPDRGVMIDGELGEHSRLGLLQGKAVGGLAYLNDEDTNQVVFETVGRHPLKAVRAEAINAYLWNHGDSPEARATLAQYVRPEDAIFIDRVRKRKNDEQDSEAFDESVRAFLNQHPEAVPPPPERVQNTQPGRKQLAPQNPPNF